ncbi:MAG: GspH/FimT family pseudopilin [Rubrivivax sp.]|nr:GspH/FimT family pseudopilin [Rubrivivax sp.]
MLGPLMAAFRGRRSTRGLSLIELLIGLAVVAMLVAFAVPSLADFVRMQRLRAINAEMVNDLQFARSEATARNQYVHVRFRPAGNGMTCYAIYLVPPNQNTVRCDCRTVPEPTCQAGGTLLRTVRVPTRLVVNFSTPADQGFGFAFDHISGGIVSVAVDFNPPALGLWSVDTKLDDERVLRNHVCPSGRVRTCAPSSKSVGAADCPENPCNTP